MKRRLAIFVSLFLFSLFFSTETLGKNIIISRLDYSQNHIAQSLADGVSPCPFDSRVLEYFKKRAVARGLFWFFYFMAVF